MNQLFATEHVAAVAAIAAATVTLVFLARRRHGSWLR